MRKAFAALLLVVSSQVSAKFYGNAKERMAALHKRALALQQERQLSSTTTTTCSEASQYYECANIPVFGSCAAAQQCIESEGEEYGKRALRAIQGQQQVGGGKDACWPTSPTCCDLGYEFGFKIDSCSTSGETYCLKDGANGASRGSVDIQCPNSKRVEWKRSDDGDVVFEAAFRTNIANKMYKDEKDLVCGTSTTNDNIGISSGSIQGIHHDTSHFELCWNGASTAENDPEVSEDL